MYDHRLYTQGVHSIFVAEWRLICKTPLAIRNGKALAYTERSDKPKSRGRELALKWQAPNKIGQSGITEAEMASLAYGYEVAEDRVVAYHVVPPSSVRGSLRSWTLRHLLAPEFRGKLTPPEGKDDDADRTKTTLYLNDIRRALECRLHGFELTASLFGLATDTRPGEEMPSNAGRLRVETERFEAVDATTIDAGGPMMTAPDGPHNVRRQMRVRNPLDRITHGSKERGLHHFLEICRGERFTVRMSIVNPLDCDLGLLSLWQRELDDGMLRLGALSSIGRGRVGVDEQKYTLWKRPGGPNLAGMKHFAIQHGVDADESSSSADALLGLWDSYHLQPEQLSTFESHLNEFAGGDA